MCFSGGEMSLSFKQISLGVGYAEDFPGGTDGKVSVYNVGDSSWRQHGVTINCLCCITNYFPNLVVQSNKHLYYYFCELGGRAHLVEWLWFRISQKLKFRYWQGCGLMWGLRRGGISGLPVWLSAGPSSPLALGWGSCFPAACLLLASLGCLPGAPLQREPHTCQLPFLRVSEHSPRGPSVTSDIVAVLYSPLKNYTSYSPPQMRGCHIRVTKWMVRNRGHLRSIRMMWIFHPILTMRVFKHLTDTNRSAVSRDWIT